jgi:hypothetical protein
LYTDINKPLQFHDGYAEVNCMIIHFDLYEKIINEIYSRNLIDENLTCGEYLCVNIKSRLESFYDEYYEFNKKKAKDKKNLPLLEYYQNQTIETIMNNIFHSGTESNTIKWKYFVDKILENKKNIEYIANSIAEINALTLALNLLRKGYLLTFCYDSNVEETRLHILLAKYITEKVAKITEKQLEADGNIDKSVLSTGFAQPLSIFLEDVEIYNQYIVISEGGFAHGENEP